MSILYLMHIHWNWAKQRPQFIAEELEKKTDLKVLYLKSYRSRNLKPNKRDGISRGSIFILPFRNKFSLIHNINQWLINIQVGRAPHTDIVWITSPIFLHAGGSGSKLIYDCMDDFLEFPVIKKKKWLKRFFFNAEKRILERAEVTFFSSETLRGIVCKRYNLPEDNNRQIVINNAIKDLNKISVSGNKAPLPTANETIQVTYIGTVSEWFDFEIIKKHIQANEKVIYNIYGPTEVVIPNIKRLVYHGPIEHDRVFSVMESSDILVMPFIVNDLIQSVNPVKLYEYVYSGKPVIAVAYSESEKFSDYVYLYKDYEDFAKCVTTIAASGFKGKKSLEACRTFANENTWQKRGELISKHLEGLIR